MTTECTFKLHDEFTPNVNENIVSSLFKQYERVIIESLITSFGMDFLLFQKQDKYGGDVDTIHNVRKIDKDSQMQYKNVLNAVDYSNQEKYNTKTYHSDKAYKQEVHEAKSKFNNEGKWIDDNYVEGNKVAPISNKNIPRGRQGQLDHVISAEKIHNDRGRVLSGLDGKSLANNPENLRYTNAALNLNLSNMSVEEYISWCEANPDKVNYNGNTGEPLPESVKTRLRSEYTRAKKDYDTKVSAAYYTSSKFAKDTFASAAKVGVRMGVRQIMGLVFAEIWFAVKEIFEKSSQTDFEFENFLQKIAKGIKQGVANAKAKYKDLIKKFEEGALAGVLSSITTTLCNIFFTTAKNTVKIIRQTWASLVEAIKIILFNPDNLLLGERFRATAKILATGASIVVGQLIDEIISKTTIGTIPVVGEIIQNFCSILTTGIMSCTLLYYLDNSKLIKFLVNKMNDIPSVEKAIMSFRRQADILEQYAAELINIDLETFKREIREFASCADRIDSTENQYELKAILHEAYSKLNIKIPWGGDFDSFMSNKNSTLVFE